jgi:hypothetical protein
MAKKLRPGKETGRKEVLFFSFVLLSMIGLFAPNLWCNAWPAPPEDKIVQGQEEDVLTLVSFPEDELPIKKWLAANDWKEKKGKAKKFVIKEKTLFMRNDNASTTIGTKLKNKIDPRLYSEIEFRIRVDEIPFGTNVRIKSKDDAAFRLFVLFDKGGNIISPPQTIGYVWDSTMAKGETGRSPRFSKVRYITIGSGEKDLGKWTEFRRNLLEDYKMLFNTEKVPMIAAIGLKCDSNHSNGSASSAVQWIRLRKKRE